MSCISRFYNHPNVGAITDALCLHSAVNHLCRTTFKLLYYNRFRKLSIIQKWKLDSYGKRGVSFVDSMGTLGVLFFQTLDTLGQRLHSSSRQCWRTCLDQEGLRKWLFLSNSLMSWSLRMSFSVTFPKAFVMTSDDHCAISGHMLKKGKLLDVKHATVIILVHGLGEVR